MGNWFGHSFVEQVRSSTGNTVRRDGDDDIPLGCIARYIDGGSGMTYLLPDGLQVPETRRPVFTSVDAGQLVNTLRQYGYDSTQFQAVVAQYARHNIAIRETSTTWMSEWSRRLTVRAAAAATAAAAGVPVTASMDSAFAFVHDQQQAVKGAQAIKIEWMYADSDADWLQQHIAAHAEEFKKERYSFIKAKIIAVEACFHSGDYRTWSISDDIRLEAVPGQAVSGSVKFDITSYARSIQSTIERNCTIAYTATNFRPLLERDNRRKNVPKGYRTVRTRTVIRFDPAPAAVAV